MGKPDATSTVRYSRRVVHKSVVVDLPGLHRVDKLMLNLSPPGASSFAAGSDVAFPRCRTRSR